jgi:hypothetical protein
MGFGDISPDNVLEGGTDGTKIGNVGDSLKVQVVSNYFFAQTTINFEHQMVHIGRSFSLDHTYTLNTNATHDHILVSPDTTRNAHLIVIIMSKGDCSYELYEDPTCTYNTEVVTINRNRNSANVNTTKVYNLITLTNQGTLVAFQRIGLGGPQSQGGLQESTEVVLKRNTNYLIRVKSNENGNIISSSTRWYEYDYTSPTG